SSSGRLTDQPSPVHRASKRCSPVLQGGAAARPLTSPLSGIFFLTAEDSPMRDEDALLRAIDAEPHDDLPRLAYADWLEENGQAEGAGFIRVQCRLGGGYPLGP